MKRQGNSFREAALALREYKAWMYTGWSRLKSRFSRTRLGTLWILIANCLSIAILGFIYTKIFPSSNPVFFLAYIGSGYAIWAAMSSAIFSALSLTEYHSQRMLNTNRNHFFYIYEEVYYQLINFSIGSLQILIFMLLIQTQVEGIVMNAELILKLCMGGVNYILFLYLISLTCSLLGAYMPDLTQVVPAILQLSFLTSPIMFQASAVGELGSILMLNPLYWLLSLCRDPILWSSDNAVSTIFIAKSLLVLFVMCMVMTCVYHRNRYQLVYHI